MEVEHFFGEDLVRREALVLLQLLRGEKVGVVGGVDGLRGAKDKVGGRETAAQGGVVFNVVDTSVVSDAVALFLQSQWILGGIQKGCSVEYVDDLLDGLQVFARHL